MADPVTTLHRLPINAARIATRMVMVHDLRVEAAVGINRDEQHRTQPLIVSVELSVGPIAGDRIEATIDYCAIVSAAERLAQQRNGLIETYAERLATECIALGDVIEAVVTVAKPEALPNGQAAVRVVAQGDVVVL